MSASMVRASSLLRAKTLPLPAFFLAAFFLLSSEAKADCIDYGDYLHSLGSLDFMTDSVSGVAVVGTLAYVTTYYPPVRLYVIDVSNPAAPTILGSAAALGHAQNVAISGTKAYVAIREGGLQIFDVSNSASPVSLGRVFTPGWAIDVAASGNLGYVVDGTSLQIVNASVPASPVIVGSVNTPSGGSGIALYGTIAYVAGSSGLQVINVSNPTNPTIVMTLSMTADDIVVSGTTGYVSTNSGVQMINLSNPS